MIIRTREPKTLMCPSCRVKMIWHGGQGPLGGWKCPSCGQKIDRKSYD